VKSLLIAGASLPLLRYKMPDVKVPYILYGLPGDPHDKESWRKAKELGIDYVTMVEIDEYSMLHAEEYGLNLFARLDYVFPEAFIGNEFDYRDLLLRLQFIELNMVIAGWEIDEPDYIKCGENGSMCFLEDFLKWLRISSLRKFPLRITDYGRNLSDKSWELLRRLSAAYGGNVILGPDIYAPPKRIMDVCRQYPKKHWVVIPAQGDLKDTELKDMDELTADDIYYSMCAAYAGGARGIGFYDNPPGCGYEDAGYSRTYPLIKEAIAKFELIKNWIA